MKKIDDLRVKIFADGADKEGMLEIHLKQEVPEALKPKEIEIKF